MKTAAVAVVLLLAATTAAADPPADALRRRGVDLAYDLDFSGGRAAIREATTLAPDDPANPLALASVLWVEMLFRRGALTVDDYLGPASLDDVARTPPAEARVSELRATLTQAVTLARTRLARNPSDVSALYAVGAAAAREAAYLATEEGRIMRAFLAARRAYDAHARVLTLEPSRADAGLVVGTFRYLVATLSPVARWLAYLAGFGGDRGLALRLLEHCASVPSEAGAEARFALVITYSREGRHDDALRHLSALRDRYPHNRLLWLETGATLLRAGRPEDALRWLDEGLARLASDARPRSFGEDAWWHYQRGLALARLGRAAEAAAEARDAATHPSHRWVKGRVLTLTGQVADLEGQRSVARAAYARAVEIARSTRDVPGVQEAQRWADKPFRGTSPRSPRQYE